MGETKTMTVAECYDDQLKQILINTAKMFDEQG